MLLWSCLNFSVYFGFCLSKGKYGSDGASILKLSFKLVILVWIVLLLISCSSLVFHSYSYISHCCDVSLGATVVLSSLPYFLFKTTAWSNFGKILFDRYWSRPKVYFFSLLSAYRVRCESWCSVEVSNWSDTSWILSADCCCLDSCASYASSVEN